MLDPPDGDGTRGDRAVDENARAIKALADRGEIAAALNAEHQTIEGGLHTLGDAVLAGANKGVLTQLVSMVVNFCVDHFASEEQVLRDNGYLEIDAHADAHRQLLKAFRAAHTAMEEGQLEATLDVSDLLMHLHEHIAGFDEPAYAQCGMGKAEWQRPEIPSAEFRVP
jgi:hemerythrin-like metal-binding protein